MSTPSPTTLRLYSYFRSSCSARVRIAANLKSLPLSYVFVHLVKGEQSAPDYVSDVNPSSTVPTLIIERPDLEPITIRQSVAILEFLEEYYPERTALLPAANDPIKRAKVRELVNIIANDVQPPTNLHILNRVKALGGESQTWAKEVMSRGLGAFEKLASSYAGKYCVGDEITMADVVLAPAVEGAIRWGFDIDTVPTIKRVWETIRVLPAFEQGDWRHQPDTPDEFKR